MRALFCVVLAAVLATAASAGCSDQIQTCYSCTGSPSGDCGWNAGSQTCERGTSAGPAGSVTTPAGWFWRQVDCCSTHTNCGDCTSASSERCGWNKATGTCQYGNSLGPDSASTVHNSWAWTSGQCTQEDSSSTSNAFCDWNFDCSSCIDTAGCGWDDVLDQCESGNSYGPYNGFTSDWKYYNCNTMWTWRFSYDSASMWLTWSIIVLFIACCSACCRRRRRITVIAAGNAPVTGAPLMSNAQNVQGGYGTQAPPPAYGTAPSKQQPSDLYGPSQYENTQAEGV